MMYLWLLVVFGITVGSAVFGFALGSPLLLTLSVLGIAELALSFFLIRENERVVPILLGIIGPEYGPTLSDAEKQQGKLLRRGLFGTGLGFLPFPLYAVRRYPMFNIQLVKDVGEVTTRPGGKKVPKDSTQPPAGDNLLEDRRFGPAELKLKVVANIQFDVSNLEPAVKNLPPFQVVNGKLEGPLADLFGQELDDAVKRACADKTWYDIYFDRGGIEREIENILFGLEEYAAAEKDSSFVKAGIQTRALLRIAIAEVRLPPTLATSINAEQEQLFKADAKRREAEGLRDARAMEGEGEAKFRDLIYRVTRGANKEQFDQNQRTEALRALFAIGTSSSSKIFAIPDILTDVFGRDKAMKLVEILGILTPGESTQLLRQYLGELGQGGGQAGGGQRRR